MVRGNDAIAHELGERRFQRLLEDLFQGRDNRLPNTARYSNPNTVSSG
jgi:hypothetical protein